MPCNILVHHQVVLQQKSTCGALLHIPVLQHREVQSSQSNITHSRHLTPVKTLGGAQEMDRQPYRRVFQAGKLCKTYIFVFILCLCMFIAAKDNLKKKTVQLQPTQAHHTNCSLTFSYQRDFVHGIFWFWCTFLCILSLQCYKATKFCLTCIRLYYNITVNYFITIKT